MELAYLQSPQNIQNIYSVLTGKKSTTLGKMVSCFLILVPGRSSSGLPHADPTVFEDEELTLGTSNFL
jgi:hypothetical protein